MSILDRLGFGKKKDDFSDLGLDDLGIDDKGTAAAGADKDPFGALRQQPENTSADDFGLPHGTDSFGQQPLSARQQQFQQSAAGYPGQQPGQQQFQQFQRNPDLEVISAKLDALRALLDSINQRLVNLERSAGLHHDKSW